MKKSITELYNSIFTSTGGAPVTVRSPGRVNFLGAHTDYSGGLVLPAAIEMAVSVCGEACGDTAEVHSTAFGETIEFRTDDIRKGAGHSWADYVRGVVFEFKKRFGAVPGFRAVIDSDLPVDSGLSSSAALEVGIAVFLREIMQVETGMMDIAQIAQRAENDFVGMQCGIMDQMAAAFGRENMLMFINCGTLEYEYIPWNAERAFVLIVDTGIRRRLAGSQFNLRRIMVLDALEIIRKTDPFVANSSDITPDMYARFRESIPVEAEPLIRHVVMENERVRRGAEALRRDDYALFGRLMTESYDSSRDLFQVTIPELDFISAKANASDFAYGTKLMGGGFGGVVAVITPPDGAGEFTSEIVSMYCEKFADEPHVFVCRPSAGVTVSRG